MWIDVIDIKGNTHTFKQSCLRGGKQEPMSQQELEGKFINNLVFAGLDNQEIESARDRINQLFDSTNNIRECVERSQ